MADRAGVTVQAVTDAEREQRAAALREETAALERLMVTLREGAEPARAARGGLSKSGLRRAQLEADGQGAHAEALAELEAIHDARRCIPVHSAMPDRELCRLAELRSQHMTDFVRTLLTWALDPQAATLIGERVAALGGKPIPWAGDLDAIAKRARCPLWWRRHLRRLARTLREREGRMRGEMQRQTYVTNDTLRAHIEGRARNAAILEATVIESEDGEELTLAQAAGASVSNRSIRRGELMTRIRGCEEWAEGRGMAGLFTTNTAPSRFHPQHFGGGRNHRHFGDESKSRLKGKERRHGNYGPTQPNDAPAAQAWLCATWARTRSELARVKHGRWACRAEGCERGRAKYLFGVGVPVFGFRVAEPHHDGCPHWHMLLWTAREFLPDLRRVMRSQWLKDHPEEWGASEHRFKSETMRAGGAAGYIAKYIAKNIDDPEAVHDGDGQDDEWATGEQGRLFGGAAAKRVEAWASTHFIRQFQAIGQPPVTVWRELRRIDAERAAGGSKAVQLAHTAATRDIFRKADWRAYLEAQGGAMQGRRYAVRLLTEETETEGRYGMALADRPMGVVDRQAPDAWILSNRREWKPRGTWAPRVPAGPALGVFLGGARVASRALARPWTRVNNCTDDGGVAELMRSGLVGLTLRKNEPGGSNTTEEPPWKSSPPSNPPLTLPSRPSSTRFTPSARA
jgi:hypothetical protein